MANFPTLNSGAVAQYPLLLGASQNTALIRFLDGSDQRFLTAGKQFRSWEIRLSMLTDSEMAQIESFFTSQQGQYSPFTFPDPISTTLVPNCVIGSSELVTAYENTESGSASLWVIETNG